MKKRPILFTVRVYGGELIQRGLMIEEAGKTILKHNFGEFSVMKADDGGYDLFTKSFDENNWVKNPYYHSDKSDRNDAEAEIFVSVVYSTPEKSTSARAITDTEYEKEVADAHIRVTTSETDTPQERLSMTFSAWLAAQDAGGVPVAYCELSDLAALVASGTYDDLRLPQMKKIIEFSRSYQDLAMAHEISMKWVERIGMGYHPDTPADDYDPPLSKVERSEYSHDMRQLFGFPSIDPYEIGLSAMRVQYPSAFTPAFS